MFSFQSWNGSCQKRERSKLIWRVIHDQRYMMLFSPSLEYHQEVNPLERMKILRILITMTGEMYSFIYQYNHT